MRAAAAKLVETHHREKGRAHLLYLPSMILGRHGRCDIVIDQAGVSRRHARITESDGRYRLIDLGSMNGTYVDGTPTLDCELLDGAEIHIGGVTFTFVGPRADNGGGPPASPANDGSPPAAVVFAPG
jgi:pSer/pThr/pTyr-binding forkhead associated (FHA) protein